MALAHLTIAFNSDGLLNKIVSAKKADWPSRLAYKLMDVLKTRFSPKDRMSIVKRTPKLNSLRVQDNKNPANLFEGIKAIDNQFKNIDHNLTKDDKIAAILEKASTKYSVILSNTAQEKVTR